MIGSFQKFGTFNLVRNQTHLANYVVAAAPINDGGTAFRLVVNDVGLIVTTQWMRQPHSPLWGRAVVLPIR